jgi:flagellar biosynthesis protein FlgN
MMQTLSEKEYALFAHIMQSQNNALKTLHQCLLEEKKLLKERNRNHYKEMLEKKEQALKDVFNKEQAFLAFLKQKKMEPTKNNLMRLCTEAPSHIKKTMDALVKEMEVSLNACQKENQVNGKIIAHTQQSLNALFAVLNGTPTSQTLYTAQGYTQRTQEHHFATEA